MPPISPTPRRWILVSAVAVLAEIGVDLIGPERFEGPALPFTLLLLVLVWRRSAVARGVVVVLALTGAIIFGLGAVFGETERLHYALTALAYLGQAVPLLTPAVRDHVQKRDVATPVPASA